MPRDIPHRNQWPHFPKRMGVSRQIHAELLCAEQHLAGEHKLDPGSGAETNYLFCCQFYATTGGVDGFQPDSFATLQRLGVEKAVINTRQGPVVHATSNSTATETAPIGVPTPGKINEEVWSVLRTWPNGAPTHVPYLQTGRKPEELARMGRTQPHRQRFDRVVVIVHV